MTLWLTALPFALLGSCGWLTIPTVGVVAYALLGIESIGVEIENPCVTVCHLSVWNRAWTQLSGQILAMALAVAPRTPAKYMLLHHRGLLPI